MKAIQVSSFGGPEVLQVVDLPQPKPSEGQILVKVKAIGINPVETYIRSGTYARLPALPFTPGTDAAGIVEAVGKGVHKTKVGDKVFTSGSLSGSYAEYLVATEEQVHPYEDRLSFSQAAALGIPYATAYRALFQKGNLQAGESVMVHGGSGGVGIAAIQLAKSAGATVIATAGSEEGKELVRKQGADYIFDHSAPNYKSEIAMFAEQNPIHLLLEMLANRNLALDLELMGRNGRIVIIGSRGEIQINPRDIMAKELRMTGMVLSQAPPDELEEAYTGLSVKIQEHALNPVIAEEIPLTEASRAHEIIMSPGAKGKIVLVC